MSSSSLEQHNQGPLDELPVLTTLIFIENDAEKSAGSSSLGKVDAAAPLPDGAAATSSKKFLEKFSCTVATKTARLFPVLDELIKKKSTALPRSSTIGPPGTSADGSNITASAAETSGSPPSSITIDFHDDLGLLLTRHHFAVALNRVGATPVATPREDAILCRLGGLQLMEERHPELVEETPPHDKQKQISPWVEFAKATIARLREDTSADLGRHERGRHDRARTTRWPRRCFGTHGLYRKGRRSRFPRSKRRKITTTAGGLRGPSPAARRSFQHPSEILWALGVTPTRFERLLHGTTLPPPSCWLDDQGRRGEEAASLIDMHTTYEVREGLGLGGGRERDARTGRPPIVGARKGSRFGFVFGRDLDDTLMLPDGLDDRDDVVVLQRPNIRKEARTDSTTRGYINLWPQKLGGVHQLLAQFPSAKTAQQWLKCGEDLFGFEDEELVGNHLCAELMQLRFSSEPGAQLVLAGGSVFKAFMGQNLGESDLDMFLVAEGEGLLDDQPRIAALAREAVLRIDGHLRENKYEIQAIQRTVNGVSWYVRSHHWERDDLYDGKEEEGSDEISEWKSFVLRTRVRALQLIGLYPDIESLLSGFDVPCCQLACTSATVLATPGCYKALKHGFMVARTEPFEQVVADIDPSRPRALRCTRTYQHRLLKYAKRGMTIVLPAGVGHGKLLSAKLGPGSHAPIRSGRPAWSLFKRHTWSQFKHDQSFFEMVLIEGERVFEQEVNDEAAAQDKAKENSRITSVTSSSSTTPDPKSILEILDSGGALWLDPKCIDASFANVIRSHTEKASSALRPTGTSIFSFGPSFAKSVTPEMWQRQHGSLYFTDNVADIIYRLPAPGDGALLGCPSPSISVHLPESFVETRKLFPNGQLPVPTRLFQQPLMRNRRNASGLEETVSSLLESSRDAGPG